MMKKILMKFSSFNHNSHLTSGCIDRPVMSFKTIYKLEHGLPLSAFDNKCLTEYKNYIEMHR